MPRGRENSRVKKELTLNRTKEDRDHAKIIITIECRIMQTYNKEN